MENFWILFLILISFMLFFILISRHFKRNFSVESAWIFAAFFIPILILLSVVFLKSYVILAGITSGYTAMISESCREIISSCSKTLLQFTGPLDGIGKISLLIVLFSFMAAAGMTLGRFLSTKKYIKSISKKSILPDSRVINLFEEMKRKMKIKNASLRIVDYPKSIAFNLGVLNPFVFISNNLIKILDSDELESVILHELVHIQRRDNIKQWVGVLLKETTWFLPTSSYCWKYFTKEREESADRKAVEITGKPLVMASALLKYVKSFQQKPLWVASGLAMDSNDLNDRINNLAGNKNSKSIDVNLKSILFTITFTAIVLSILAIPLSKSAIAVNDSKQLPSCCVKHNHTSCTSANCGTASR